MRTYIAIRFMTGYELHPEARFDLDDIWEFIRVKNLDAADRVIAVMHGHRSPRVMAAIPRGREQDPAGFRAAVLEGEAYADRGEFIEENEMNALFEQMLRS